MKKAIHKWIFNLFTKRITIKVANLPNDARIEYLVNKLMNELIAQGHNPMRNGADNEYLAIWGFGDRVHIDSNGFRQLVFKRLRKV